MSNQVIMQAALANTGLSNSSEELLNFVRDNTSAMEFYKFKPEPGTIVNSGLDWQAVIGTVASIATLGQVLWAAYEKFILPRKKNESFLFVQVRNGYQFAQFAIGKEYKNKEIFIKEFSEKVEKIRFTDEGQELETRSVEESTVWIKD